VLIELGRWGSAAPAPPDSQMSVDSHMLALMTLFDARAAAEEDLSVALQIDDGRFAAQVREGALRLTRGELEDPEATLRTDRQTLRALLWEGMSVPAARRAGRAQLEGSSPVLARFLRLFPRREAGVARRRPRRSQPARAGAADR
jgi:alkyl sulfatase BDS1-like metallo-beta-lactamase superfamily hydrolase